MRSAEPTLECLIADCKAGSDAAWESLVKRYQNRVFGLAYHYTGNRDDALDLTQDIFVRVYRNLSRCTHADGFAPWLLRIARNASIDFLRRKGARPSSDLVVEEALGLSDPGSDPQEILARESRRELLYTSLGTLTRFNREVIFLKEIQGLTLEEVARMLDAPVGTIKSRMHRARQALERCVLERAAAWDGGQL